MMAWSNYRSKLIDNLHNIYVVYKYVMWSLNRNNLILNWKERPKWSTSDQVISWIILNSELQTCFTKNEESLYNTQQWF